MVSKVRCASVAIATRSGSRERLSQPWVSDGARIGRAVMVGMLSFVTVSTAFSAGIIRSPVSATATVPPASPGDLQNAINQAGLSVKFVDGATDFDAYLAQQPTHDVLYFGYEWFSQAGVTSATLIFDMGAVTTMDRLAMWNEESSGIDSFTIAYSTDGITYTTVPGTFSPTNWPSYPQTTAYTANIFQLGGITGRYVKMQITCPQAGAIYPGCSLGEIAFSTTPTAKVEIVLSSPPANDKYLITATPSMPVIKAKATVVGVIPDPTANTAFTWTADLTATKGTGQSVSYKSYITQSQMIAGSAEYTFAFTNAASILGGNLNLTATATINSKQVMGSTVTSLAIHGTNPQRTNILGRVDTAVDARSFSGLTGSDVKDALKRVGCQESRHKQFTGAVDGGTGPVLISPDNGIGIFQLTSGDPLTNKPSVAFDWRANVDEGSGVFAAKVKVARGYAASLRVNALFKQAFLDDINPARCDAGLQPIGLPLVGVNPPNTYASRCRGTLVSVPGSLPIADYPLINQIGTAPINMLLEDGVRGYNGYGTKTLYGVALREFRPDINFLKNLPDNALAGLATNTAIWERVPVADRGTSGDPDYVNRVTQRQPSCP